MTLELDWETRSEIDLLKRGPYVYAMHHSTDALIASYQIDGGEMRRWRRGEPCPDDIRAHIEAGGMVTAHNAAFERLIWWFVMSPRHGWPRPKLEQFRCTAVTAAAMSLPRSLDRLGAALDLPVQKDKKGKTLIKIHSVPQSFDSTGKPVWHPLVDDPTSMGEFHDYCDDDVRTEALADARLVPLSADEQDVYVLAERINDRGIRIDVQSARAALQIIEKAKQRVNDELAQITERRVKAVTETAKMKKWIAEQGVEMPSMDKDDVEEFLNDYDDLPPDVRRVLELRQEGAKPSVEKIGAMLDRVCDDGRARGVYLTHGAGQTGRFSSRGLQAHNMPKYRKAFEKAVENKELRLNVLFKNIRTGDPEVLEYMYGPMLGRPLHLLSDAVRGFLWAAPGHEFINADFTSIEGVMGAWFAKEEWKLQAFRDLFAGRGHGIYELTAAGIYGIAVEDVTSAERPTGKVAELSCQYQTGAGGIRKFARQNKIKLPSLYENLWRTADEEVAEGLEKRFADRLQKHDPHAEYLGREGWIAAELIKTGWRTKHPRIVDAWADLDNAMTLAVENPGLQTTALFGRVSYRVRNNFLWCRLPSGRCLAYGKPRIENLDAPWADKTVEPAKREKKLTVTALGVDPQTEKWVRSSLYGGKLFNNVVQGSARDVLVHGMRNAEAAGYPIVLHTHDECMSELPIGQGDYREFEKIICQLPAWTEDMPMKSSGWAGKRYRK